MPWSYDSKASTVTCTHCGFSATIETFRPGKGPQHDCQPKAPPRKSYARPPCMHLGAETRVQACETCPGSPRIKVFACALFGECTVVKKLDGVAVCNGPEGVACKRYSAVGSGPGQQGEAGQEE